jgi:hypothetical protein
MVILIATLTLVLFISGFLFIRKEFKELHHALSMVEDASDEQHRL